jgi:hypothetical protein
MHDVPRQKQTVWAGIPLKPPIMIVLNDQKLNLEKTFVQVCL